VIACSGIPCVLISLRSRATKNEGNSQQKAANLCVQKLAVAEVIPGLSAVFEGNENQKLAGGIPELAEHESARPKLRRDVEHRMDQKRSPG
jgi:hypothetical protein